MAFSYQVRSHAAQQGLTVVLLIMPVCRQRLAVHVVLWRQLIHVQERLELPATLAQDL